MTDASAVQRMPKPKRIVSIDVLRGLTILVMIFVNDLSGVANAPGWMKHFYPWDADGMTFVDVVFPAFLFIVGMAIPFSIGRRLERGDSVLKILKHVLIRTAGLLIIGVFMVNNGTISTQTPININLWIVLSYIAVIFVWNTVPREPGKARQVTLTFKFVGVAMLIILALIYRDQNVEGFFQMRPQWWGILGLIGWAYLVAVLFYMLFRNYRAIMLGISGLLYCVFMADRMGVFQDLWLDSYVDFGSMLGSHAALTVGGIVIGQILKPDSPAKTHKDKIMWALFYGLLLFSCGRLLYSLRRVDNMFIINKNLATPPWCLISAAYTVWIWVFIYWLMDVKGIKKWAIVLRPAGENPLFAYILQPLIYNLFILLALYMPNNINFHAKLGEYFWLGLFRAVIFAFLVTWITGYLKKVGIRLKL